MPSEQFTATIAMVAATEQGTEATVAERRATIDGLGALLGVAPGVTVESVDADGVPAAWMTPADPAAGTVLWLHGGGYNIGSITSHTPAASHLAAHLGRRVLVIDYRLAPEHPFPAALDDAATAWGWLAGQADGDPLPALIGDSAGGGLALALAGQLRDAGGPVPPAVAVLCPWVDLTGTDGVTAEQVAADVLLTPDLLAMWAAAYAGADTPLDHPGLSPLFADLAGLPPLLIAAGGRDILCDSAHRLAEKARSAGVDVDLRVDDDMIHAWQLFAGAFPEASESLADVADWLAAHLGS